MRYNLRFKLLPTKPETVTEMEAGSSEHSGRSPDEDPINNRIARIGVRKLRKEIEREIWRQQQQDLIKNNFIKVSLLSRVNPFITECQELT
jgi:hypothetical protein